VSDFFSKFLNRPISEEVEITLSSAQRARVHGWLKKNSIKFDETRLNKKFNLAQLLEINSALTQGRNESAALGFSSNSIQYNTQNLVGIDIQSVSELFPAGFPHDPKDASELNNIFTLRELSYAQSKEDPESTLTGIFCAKEAIQKVSGLNIDLSRLEVLPDDKGRPACKGFSLSISHSGDFAIAIAFSGDEVFEGGGPIKDLADNSLVVVPQKTLSQFRGVDFCFLMALVFLGLCVWLK
jgi:phosphopantetheinyl transferase (holo-ACP synthase)